MSGWPCLWVLATVPVNKNLLTRTVLINNSPPLEKINKIETPPPMIGKLINLFILGGEPKFRILGNVLLVESKHMEKRGEREM